MHESNFNNDIELYVIVILKCNLCPFQIHCIPIIDIVISEPNEFFTSTTSVHTGASIIQRVHNFYESP